MFYSFSLFFSDTYNSKKNYRIKKLLQNKLLQIILMEIKINGYFLYFLQCLSLCREIDCVN